MTTVPNKKYGWLPDKPDTRDIPYMAMRPLQTAPIVLPAVVDLRKYCPLVFDQGSLGSCTANAISGALMIDGIRQDMYHHDPHRPSIIANEPLSRLFIYYNERKGEGTVDVDAGAFIRDGIKSVATVGVCKESLWPYDISKFKQQPPKVAYDNARHVKALVYGRVRANYLDIMTALADGNPVVFGFTVYESFEDAETARTGIMPLPTSGERVVGGHAVVAVGYDQDAHKLLVRNSWGANWGQDGYFWMPFSYVQNLTSDWWVIKTVS